MLQSLLIVSKDFAIFILFCQKFQSTKHNHCQKSKPITSEFFWEIAKLNQNGVHKHCSGHRLVFRLLSGVLSNRPNRIHPKQRCPISPGSNESIACIQCVTEL